MNARASHIHAARAFLAQVPLFRARGQSFAFRLIEWAGNARRQAMVKTNEQIELFGEMR